MADKALKQPRDRKPNFSQDEVNLMQDEVEKNYATINDKFSGSVSNIKKAAVWIRISQKVSALGVANRTAKDCKDKWGNTKKEAKKAFTLAQKSNRQTGGGPEPRQLSVAINRTIDLCKNSASFKGIGGFESSINGNIFKLK